MATPCQCKIYWDEEKLGTFPGCNAKVRAARGTGDPRQGVSKLCQVLADHPDLFKDVTPLGGVHKSKTVGKSTPCICVQFWDEEKLGKFPGCNAKVVGVAGGSRQGVSKLCQVLADHPDLFEDVTTLRGRAKAPKKGPPTPCTCVQFWDEEKCGKFPGCSAMVRGGVSGGVGVSRKGVASTCKVKDNHPELFKGMTFLGGYTGFDEWNAIPSADRAALYPRRKPKPEQYHAVTPRPLLESIMNGVPSGYPRVVKTFEIVGSFRDILSTIVPARDETQAAGVARLGWTKLLRAALSCREDKVPETLMVFDIERTETPLGKKLRRNGERGRAIVVETLQLGAVVGSLKPNLAFDDVKVILDEAKSTFLGESRVCEAMASLGHEQKSVWSYGVYPEEPMLEELDLLGNGFHNAHGVLAHALGLPPSGAHKMRSWRCPVPIGTSMPRLAQMVYSDFGAVVADPGQCPYYHVAARKCLKNKGDTDDPTATLQVMSMFAQAGLDALLMRWPEAKPWLRGEANATPPPLPRTDYESWYTSNKDYDVPTPQRPDFHISMVRAQKRKVLALDDSDDEDLDEESDEEFYGEDYDEMRALRKKRALEKITPYVGGFWTQLNAAIEKKNQPKKKRIKQPVKAQTKLTFAAPPAPAPD